MYSKAIVGVIVITCSVRVHNTKITRNHMTSYFIFTNNMGNKNLKLLNHKKNNSLSDSKISLDEINIIWLDALSNEKCDNNLKFLSELQQIVNCVRTFIDPNLCEEFLKNEIKDNQIIFLIVSGSIGEHFVPQIHELTSIDSIYVFCHDIIRHEVWSNKYSKLKGKIFCEISELCNQLKEDIRHCRNDLIPIHLSNNPSTHAQLNQLEPSFMYSQLLKETLINIEYDENAKKEFIEFCRSQLNNLNLDQMNIIDEFENDYEKTFTNMVVYKRMFCL